MMEVTITLVLKRVCFITVPVYLYRVSLCASDTQYIDRMHLVQKKSKWGMPRIFHKLLFY